MSEPGSISDECSAADLVMLDPGPLVDKPARKPFRLSAATINKIALVGFNLLLLGLEIAAIAAHRAGAYAVRDACYVVAIVLVTAVILRFIRRRAA